MDGDKLIEFVLWVLSLILAIVFFYNGVNKIIGAPPQVAQFEALGLATKLLIIVGAFECIGGLMITIPRMAVYGCSVLGLIMMASAGLHFLHDNVASSFRAVVIVVMLAGICYLRYKRRHIVFN